MKFNNCDGGCDKDGMIMTNVSESTHVQHSDTPDGFIQVEKTIKIFKKIQCKRCLYLIEINNNKITKE